MGKDSKRWSGGNKRDAFKNHLDSDASVVIGRIVYNKAKQVNERRFSGERGGRGGKGLE